MFKNSKIRVSHIIYYIIYQLILFRPIDFELG